MSTLTQDRRFIAVTLPAVKRIGHRAKRRITRRSIDCWPAIYDWIFTRRKNISWANVQFHSNRPNLNRLRLAILPFRSSILLTPV
jgi:hypothetical protein